jgi:hypothetical protein
MKDKFTKILTVLALIGVGAVVYSKYKESQKSKKEVKITK